MTLSNSKRAELPRRLRGSDPISHTCDCKGSGLVILFYGYFDLFEPQIFTEREKAHLTELGIQGKVRVSEEGINVTVGGEVSRIEEYVSLWCHRFSGLESGREVGIKEKEESVNLLRKRGLIDERFKLLAPSVRSLMKDMYSERAGDENEEERSIETNIWLENDQLKGADLDAYLEGKGFWTPFKKLFFKPTPGCQHVFDELSVKSVQEICPLGVDQTKWKPKLSWDEEEKITTEKVDPIKSKETQLQRFKLSPKDFHNLLKNSSNPEGIKPTSDIEASDIVLLDVRNYYESDLGYFDGALCPPIRNFKSLPIYLQKNLETFSNKTLVTYCTGGIRCEKATAYIRDFIQPELKTNDNLEPINAVYMLEGGIHNYLEWVQTLESPEEECLFQGRNYIFDARQSTSLKDYSIHSRPIAESKTCITKCGACSSTAAHLYKCTSQHCHKLIVRCPPITTDANVTKPSQCYLSLPSCCTDCLNSVKTKTKKIGLCACEQKRVDTLDKVQLAH